MEIQRYQRRHQSSRDAYWSLILRCVSIAYRDTWLSLVRDLTCEVVRKQSEHGACRTRPVVSFPEESKSIRQPFCKADPYGVLLILIACKECLATTTSDTEAGDNLSHTRIRYRVDDYLVNCLKISTERPLLPERIGFRRMHALNKVRCHATSSRISLRSRQGHCWSVAKSALVLIEREHLPRL